jgi:hypothetical protein
VVEGVDRFSVKGCNCMKKAYPRAKAQKWWRPGRPKAEALGYLEADASARLRVGMCERKTKAEAGSSRCSEWKTREANANAGSFAALRNDSKRERRFPSGMTTKEERLSQF